MEVRIEAVEQHGRPLWQVRLGRRGMTFHEELAARTFAAQLHQRLLWLNEQAERDAGDDRQPR